MTEQYEVDWKDYYQILQVSPYAKPEDISAAYRRLARLYSELLSEGPEEGQSFFERMADIYEAHEVLSDLPRRAMYDQVFKAKYNLQDADTKEPTKEQIVDSIALVAQEVSKQRGATRKRRVLNWRRRAH